jgi:Predicted naringenin-chalcone synthase
MDVGITAIGTANPQFELIQSEAVEFISAAMTLNPKETRQFKSICRTSGIATRYSVLSDYGKSLGQFDFFPNNRLDAFPTTAVRMKLYEAHALDLALSAISNCINNLAHFDKMRITHLITVSCTGMYAPGLDIQIVQQYGLNTTVKRTAINFMGCYAAFNAIKMADSICRADSDAIVLIVSVELCTLHVQKKNNIDVLLANAIFADGAAAVIIQSPASSQSYLALQQFHCDLLPQTNQEMAWHIADEGFDMVLSSYVPQAIQSGIAACVQRLLTMTGDEPLAVDIYAIHPGGMKILQAFEQALGVTKAQNYYAYQILQQYGNMSSATILFVLKAILDDLNASQHHKTIFSCAFGPGLTLESMLLRVHCVADFPVLSATTEMLA